MDRIAPDTVHPCLAPLIERLSALGVRRVILFGSRARGDAMPHADIDLAIDLPESDPLLWSRITQAVEQAKTLLELDAVRLQDASGSFLSNILREGKILYDQR